MARSTGTVKQFARQKLLVNELEVDGSPIGDSTMLYSFNNQYGRQVTKTGDIASAPDMLFDVTGKCLITLLTGEITSVFATTTSLNLKTSTGSVLITTSTQVTTAAAGTLYFVTGDPDDALNGGSTPNADIAFLKTGTIAPFVMNDDTIQQVVNGAGTGTVLWTLYYFPLEDGAEVNAAT